MNCTCVHVPFFKIYGPRSQKGFLVVLTKHANGAVPGKTVSRVLDGTAQFIQVAQRATIAHLSPMCQHPLISNKPASKVIKNLNSFQIREQLFFSGLSTSNVSRLNVPEIKPLVVFKHVLVTKEQASMETSLSHYNSLEYFSNTQGPLIPQ